MVRVQTLTKILHVVGLFGEATPYEIHSITQMNYESIRSTLKEAYEGGTIVRASDNTVKLSPFGEDYIAHFKCPDDINKAFNGYLGKKNKRLESQIDFLDDGKDNDKGTSDADK